MEIKKEYPKRTFPTEKIVKITLHDNAKNVGIAIVNHYTDNTSLLDWLYVNPEYQNKRYANLLMQEVVKEIDTEKNIGIVALVTEEKDSKKASYLYQKYGFEPCTRIHCKSSRIVENTVCNQSLIREGTHLKKDSEPYKKQLHSWFCRRPD